MRALAAAALVVLAQGLSAQVPGFEVASVKRVPSDGVKKPGRESIQVSPDGVALHNASLRAAIRWAYRVTDHQITGGPDWMGVERYEIVAKAAGAVPEDQLRQMLQGLLAERLKVALHRQTKELPAFVLTVGKNGPKFRESTGEGESKIEPDRTKFTVTVSRMPASQVVEMLSNILKAPVIDMTGMKGKYDATLSLSKYVPDPGATAATFDPISTIMTGLQEELGLKLESRKMPLELLIIDHVEKVPTEN